MTTEECKQQLSAVCDAIVSQNRELMDEMDDPNFDPAIRLDNTKNNAGYMLTDFFDVLKCFPHGGVPHETTDELLVTTDELLAKIRAKYGGAPKVLEETIRTGQAFRKSKRIWRISKPISPLSREEYGAKLDAALCDILYALDDLNYELNLMTTTPAPTAKPPRKRTGKSVGKGPQTDFKCRQREIFIRFLERRPITPSASKITRAHQCWLEHRQEWKLAAENHIGYASYKNLARTI